MERYLRKCLNSLILSDERMHMIEVLVINDGSKDLSSQIAHQYEIAYPLTFRVIDKENGNYGSCVNRGLKEATGKYVKILDADDSFNTKEFDVLVSILLQLDVDMVLTDYLTVDEENVEQTAPKITLPCNTILNLIDYYQNADLLYLQMHSITYKRQLLIDLKYHQTEGVSYTDKEWVFLPLVLVKTFYYSPLSVYRYLLGRVGQTMDDKIYKCNISQLMVVCNGMIEKYVYYQLRHSMIEALFYFKLSQMLKYIYRSLLIGSDQAVKELVVFDDNLRVLDSELYERSNNICLFDKIPYKLIYYWRNHGRKPLRNMIRLICNFLIMLSGHKKP